MSLAVEKPFIATRDERILVTGSNGFIGAKVVEILLEYGFRNICCFVRPSSNLARLNAVCNRFEADKSVEIVIGDLLSRDDCNRAAVGAVVVYHLAAGFDKSFAGSFMSTALATRNLMESCIQGGLLKRFVNVSTFAVYSNFKLAHGAMIDESCPLETAPLERHDAYSFGKVKQEELVREYGRERSLPYVIMRPGAVYGPGKSGLSGRVGIDTFGIFLQIGGSHLVPLTFVDNCAEAIVLGGLVPVVNGQVFNVVDDELLTARQFLREYKQRVRQFRSLWIPYSIAYLLSYCWESYSRWSEGQLPPAFNRRRCSAEWKPNKFSNRRLREQLGWRPRVKLSDALEMMRPAAKDTSR
jgi:nucleoside-diphosphate-sugar epimerase